MSLSPEDIEDQRFRDVLRGYDKAQVEEFLVKVARRYASALKPEHDHDDGLSSSVTIDGITQFHFDDALSGYDKEDVRSFLESVAADLRVLAAPNRSQWNHPTEDAGAAAPGTAEASGDSNVMAVKTARGIASAIRAAAEREAGEMRATAAEDAAKAVEAAWEEMEQATAARAAAAVDLAAATSIRSDAEREMCGLRSEGAQLVEVAHEELDEARALRAQAETDAATAATLRAEVEQKLADVISLADEQEERAAGLLDEARRAASEVLDGAQREAAQLRDEARTTLERAKEKQRQAESLGAEAKREAAEIRALAVEAARALKAEAEELSAAIDAELVAVEEEVATLRAHAKRDVETSRKEPSEAEARWSEVEAAELQSVAKREAAATGGQQLAKAVRRLEDQILSFNDLPTP